MIGRRRRAARRPRRLPLPAVDRADASRASLSQSLLNRIKAVSSNQRTAYATMDSVILLQRNPDMPRIKMGTLADVPPGKMLEKRIMARRVAVYNDHGTLYGLESDCKHMRASLTTGTVEDGVVTCKWHKWKYDLKTGECLTVKGVKLRLYDVEVEDDGVYVDF
ncbi:Rieske 2Fe-2S domain-containing protein [candidate division GN15 bacterium]|nr:Rieske 2Fe-2S domain-containing protein [candidate division GN15 bacterium]